MERRRLGHGSAVLLLAAGDLLAACVAYAAAFLLRIWVPIPFTAALLPPDRAELLHHALPLALASQIPLLWLFGLYDVRRLARGAQPLVAAAAALAIQLLLVAAAYFFRADVFFPRSVLLIFTALNVAGVAGLRVLVIRLLGRGAAATRVVLVGARRDVDDFRAALGAIDPEGRHWSVVATREVDADGAQTRAGDPVDEAALRVAEGVDEVVLVAAESWKDDFLGRLLFDGSRLARPRVAVVPTVYDLLVGRLASLQVADVPLIEVPKDPSESAAWAVKAVLDRVLALLLGLPAAPLCLVAAAVIRLTSRGPVLFRQERVGRHGRPFVMYKLRTMRRDAEAETGPTLAEADDARVTRVGRFLRATRLDEVPQLWNVLNGTMSLVGPRPERPEFAAVHQREIAGYGERWLVKPGLTGLAQVHGEYHTPTAYKLKYDLAYIYNYSLLLDLKILARTLHVLLTRRGV